MTVSNACDAFLFVYEIIIYLKRNENILKYLALGFEQCLHSLSHMTDFMILKY